MPSAVFQNAARAVYSMFVPPMNQRADHLQDLAKIIEQSVGETVYLLDHRDVDPKPRVHLTLAGYAHVEYCRRDGSLAMTITEATLKD